MSGDKIRNVLFLCTGNSARSVLSEAYLNALPGGRFRAFSAGSQPAGRVNPFAIATLKAAGIPAEGYRSKSWDEFAAPGAPQMDIIITVCDNAAGEVCPIWPGHPSTAHWPYRDPAAAEGTDDEIRAVFEDVFREIRARIDAFAALPFDTLDDENLKARLRALGETSEKAS
ncbi:arsenate reductase ArsC [Parvibaculum sp.]|uniref:arsenate reductase ArsC n=1 Tax=Parvibaculum sp. TaxID=2024848 RepID=UPI00391D1A6F